MRGQPPSHTGRVPEDLLRRRGRLIRVPVDQTLTDQLVKHSVMLRRSLAGLVLHELPDGVEPNDVMILKVEELQVVPPRSLLVSSMVDNLNVEVSQGIQELSGTTTPMSFPNTPPSASWYRTAR